MILTASVIVVLSTDAEKYRHNMNLGRRYLTNNEYESAVRAFDAAIGIRTESGEAYMGRGDAYAGLGETESAGNDYETARTLDPSLDKKVERRIDDLYRAKDYEISENPK
jgi:Flp pilus assembly protein TadD